MHPTSRQFIHLSSTSERTICLFPSSVQNLLVLCCAHPTDTLDLLESPSCCKPQVFWQPPREIHRNPSLGTTVVTVYVYLRPVTFVRQATAEGEDCLLRLEQISQGPGLPACQLLPLLLQRRSPGSLRAGANTTRSGSFIRADSGCPRLGVPTGVCVAEPRSPYC